jgi:hypothetical protein
MEYGEPSKTITTQNGPRLDGPACSDCEESEWMKIAQRRADKLNIARELLVEARGYLDRMGQDGVRERIDQFLNQNGKDHGHE